jgi:acetyl esterase/lipase
MTYRLDPQLVPAMEALAGPTGDAPASPARGDWKATRERGEAGQAAMAALVPASCGVRSTQRFAVSADGTLIELRWYTSTATVAESAAVVYAHGGGMIMGTLYLYDEVISWSTRPASPSWATVAAAHPRPARRFWPATAACPLPARS